MPALPCLRAQPSPARRRSASARRAKQSLLVAGPLALLLSACGSAGGNASAGEYGDSTAAQSSSAPAAPGTPDGTPGAGSGEPVVYEVDKYTFPALTVAPGTHVRVIDGDDEPHTVTAEDGSFDTGSFDPDTPGSFTAPTKPGTYRVTCTVHPSMHGEIVVR